MPGYDPEFLSLRTAKSWGLTPRQWREQSLDDRQLMMGLEIFEGTIEGYRAEYREDRRKNRENRGGGGNDYERLKQRIKQK